MRVVETIDAAKHGTMMVCVVTVAGVDKGAASESEVGGTPVKAVIKEENMPALFLWVGLGGAVLVSLLLAAPFVELPVVVAVVSLVGTVTWCRCQVGAYLNSQIQHIPP